jgi:hypothetical protein
MFSNVTIALLISLSSGAWIYTKTQRSTGNNTQTSLIVAGISAGILFILTLIVLGLVF